MKSRRDLIVANLVALSVLLIALLAGWKEAAALGLAILVVMDLLVLLRGQQVRSEDDSEQ
jgi:hypothetical protein